MWTYDTIHATIQVVTDDERPGKWHSLDGYNHRNERIGAQKSNCFLILLSDRGKRFFFLPSCQLIDHYVDHRKSEFLTCFFPIYSTKYWFKIQTFLLFFENSNKIKGLWFQSIQELWKYENILNRRRKKMFFNIWTHLYIFVKWFSNKIYSNR